VTLHRTHTPRRTANRIRSWVLAAAFAFCLGGILSALSGWFTVAAFILLAVWVSSLHPYRGDRP
jgi:hypothetical protein